MLSEPVVVLHVYLLNRLLKEICQYVKKKKDDFNLKKPVYFVCVFLRDEKREVKCVLSGM